VGYAELQVTTNFSFLRGASHPEELVEKATALGLTAIAITDRNSVAGVVRAFRTAKTSGLRLIVGVRLDFREGLSVLCYPTDRAAYGRLARLLTLGKRRAPKGECWLTHEDFLVYAEGQIVVMLPPDDFDAATTRAPDEAFGPDSPFAHEVRSFADRLPGQVYLAATFLYRGDDRRRIALLDALARACGAPLLATNDVHYHDPARRPLQDVLTCIREHCAVDEAGYRLFGHAERHLKPPEEMLRLFRGYEHAVLRTQEVVRRCAFDLRELRYEYPDETVPGGGDPQDELSRLTWQGAKRTYPKGIPESVKATLEHELALIAQLGFAKYFLTVNDIVRFSRSRGILCQGRGSAANSMVCYCLGITSVNPKNMALLFERFVSAERNEPPDIDIDFEHERREEIIQYIYKKYGRHRAGLTATYISYRWRSAIREVSKALGLSEDVGGALAGYVWGSDSAGVSDAQVRELGLDPEEPKLRLALILARNLLGFPRHLSQHPGGFVMTRGPLSEVVPIANAAMEDRTMIEWDKDDIDALGILKIDVLGLGMLTCIRKAFDLLNERRGVSYTLKSVPAEDPAVFDMLCRADTIGIFQVESRAQMTMLPRLRPRSFYDLVIEVAIVRPGPIQGDMVHPYLRRRNGEEKISYPSRELHDVLHKTFGVPLFQEQAMQIAVVAAKFSPGEADGLRRAMATFRNAGTIDKYRERFIEGMVESGYQREFAERCYRQIEGFGEYGFPESHAASFALLVYVSSWIKYHHPAIFACALLNSQPMGFYAPAQIIRDARDHGVRVLPVDVNFSQWDNILQDEAGQYGDALRLGFRQVKGLSEADAEKLVVARADGAYRDVYDLWRRTLLRAGVVEKLADADAFTSMGLRRRQALWAAKGLRDTSLPLFAAAEEALSGKALTRGRNDLSLALFEEPSVLLAEMSVGEEVICDYSSLSLTLKAHPVSLLRQDFDKPYLQARDLLKRKTGDRADVVGLAICRQRPGTASGVIFMTLEDETGVANIVIWPTMFKKFRKEVLRSRLLGVSGRVEREGLVVHVIASQLVDLSSSLVSLADQRLPDPERRSIDGTAAALDRAASAQPWGTANCDSVNLDAVYDRASEIRYGRANKGLAPHRLIKSRDFH
jgi:error-prone DNA polymerase